ncbi:deleted in malignant brain tumors 1 protein-like [Mytilus californianus]|uniref:deleted in malignant brain tumors 1 protein-like n=1 Tax=Mytilus californianus TaxID=6549 RepID=UPI0022470632|nr:deleted in malignant brain tumors 1 protein-like [Mytilus californianus]
MTSQFSIWIYILSVFVIKTVSTSETGKQQNTSGLRVRLVGGDGTSTGRVEIAQNGTEEWGTICDDLWSEAEAQVVCRMLHYQWGIAHTNSPFGEGVGAIHLDNVQCTGSERTLLECQSNGWGVHNCRHYEDAGVSCYNNSVRLNSRGRTDVGTVEIHTEGAWVQVCDAGWDDIDATVLCKEMGFSWGKALLRSQLGKVSSSSIATKAFTHFSCIGSEDRLISCNHTVLRSKCETKHRASAICYETRPTPQQLNAFSVRLEKGTSVWGEVSVKKLGIWGQVCASGTEWNDKAATVLCKELNQGFIGGKAYGTVNETLRPIWITKLNCSGIERSLKNCVYDENSWGDAVYSCRPAYALCYRRNVTVQLVGGGEYYGRVQINYDNQIGTVCDNSWSSSDARVVCKQLGFADGDPISKSYYGGGTGPVMMDGLGCYGYEDSLLECRNKGWLTTPKRECLNHTKDAAVICHKDVRLSRGDHSHGVVQIMDQYWSVLCGEGFNNTEARVVCLQLGFENGRVLPMGSFGTFYGRYARPNINCTGSENSILNCNYDRFRGCQRDNYLAYASVSCYNGTMTRGTHLKLEDGSRGYINQTGRVSVNQYGIWGRICPSAWDDVDADIVCKQLRHRGGVAFQQTASGSGPYFLGEVNCRGNETSLFQCPIGGDECDSQFTSGNAGVLCYNQRKPTLQLVGGTHNSGRLEVTMDNEVGSICDEGWSRYDATVACKQLGFTDGEYRRGLEGPNRPKVLSRMGCFGGESSIFMCRNPGWKKDIPSSCSNPKRDAGVFCYNNVRVSGGDNGHNTTLGMAEMYLRSTWITVCGDMFDNNAARVVCRELGFPNSKRLVNGAFGSKYYTDSVIKLNCTGSEVTIKDCQYQEGECPNRAYNYASVLCTKERIDDQDIRVWGLVENSFPAPVLIQKYGINGTICAEGWGSNDATVVCKQMGYAGGVPFGPRYYSSRTPIWMSNVSCTGTERDIKFCKPQGELDISRSCRSSRHAARVFCYRGDGFQIRLAGSNMPNSGRVEIAFNGEWGTICDSYWSDSDARVVCRQLGYVDGVAQPKGKHGPGTGRSWLYYVRCDGDEKNIWECTNSGWNVTHSSCRSHENDAVVYCTGKVRLEPNITYGAVQVWQDDGYKLVCADQFDDVDAQVVCRGLGKQNGISICCSVFGDMKHPITINNVACTGHEDSILQCQHNTLREACPSKKYAAVACSDSASSGAYELRLSSENQGVVSVRHLDVWGSICTNGFDDNDAKVICREKGFQGGFAYYQHEFVSGNRQNLPWLSYLNCTGSEGYLARCGNIRWGDVRDCSTDTMAAVYCHDNPDVHVRFVNGTSPLHGRVEINIGGQWGSVCGTSSWNDEDATVVCRMNGHSWGRALRYGKFGAGQGPIWVEYARCKGDETNIFQCPIVFNAQPNQRSGRRLRRFRPIRGVCYSHSTDAAVQCYDSVRLVDSKDVSYGRVEMFVKADKKFYSVCDTGFTNLAAMVVCRRLGYRDGLYQCCSALGHVPNANISIINIRCNGSEESLDVCPHEFGTCQSGNYVSVYCSYDVLAPKSDLQIRIHEMKYYGSLEVDVYGFWSPVCDVDWDDHDANATCHQLHYLGGVAFNGITHLSNPVSVGRFNCTGVENRLGECQYKKMNTDLGCAEKIADKYSWPTAGVLCFDHMDGIKIGINGTRTTGKVMVKFNGEWGRICNRRWDDKDSKVFCKQMGFIDGRSGPRAVSRSSGYVWIDNVDCDGSEDSLLKCRLTWDADYSSCDDATVVCMEAVRLNKGDDKTHGVVQVHVNDNWGTVCNHKWGQEEIDVTCRQLGLQHGVSVCCGAYGYMYTKGVLDNVTCSGPEDSLLKCDSSAPYSSCSRDYAAVACYNGTLPPKTNYTLDIEGRSNISGSLNINFLNITGRICADDWDDKDATVACRQLGYSKGSAYPHKVLFGEGKPIWASNINCTGNEFKLADCPGFNPGTVKMCTSRRDAGVVCYSNLGVYFRLAGGYSKYGRVEMSVDGVWGTICNRYWDKMDASVFCKSIGFATGFPYYKDSIKVQTGRIYEPNLHCNGDESTLNECAHEGWKVASSIGPCSSHEKDATVHCYNSVKLDTGVGTEVKHGPVMIYYNESWSVVCDKGFTDQSAKVVCKELGFEDGKAVTGSAYGKTFDLVLKNKSLICQGNEKDALKCLTSSDCGRYDNYASVMCYMMSDNVKGPGYKIDFEKSTGVNISAGTLSVEQYGVKGHISSRFWDDTDAMVFCKSKGFKSGFMYQQSPDPFHKDPPITLGDFNCTGNEASLLNCSFNSRFNLGNNTMSNRAGAVCYNQSGVNYRIVGGEKDSFGRNKTGRVELQLNGQWGTVCDTNWDDREASVLCRSLNFSDGYAIKDAHYGQGTGPVWIGYLNCNGTEKYIHSCSHRGFNDAITKNSWKKCTNHRNDASVACVDKVRLSLGLNATMGAVEVYNNKQWMTVCDVGFNKLAAEVICRSMGFSHGTEMEGSVFGNKTGPIGLIDVHCGGDESDLFKCRYAWNSAACRSKKYASVYCSNEDIVATAFDSRIVPDDKSDTHGTVQVKISGVWGSVCSKGWSNAEANLVCKKNGFTGGVPYRVPETSQVKPPILMSNVRCRGSEADLDKCSFTRSGQLDSCEYTETRAGVLCYKTSGIHYSLVGGPNNATGRVKIMYDGQAGGVCNFLWDSRDAQVFCKSLGYKGGIEIAGAQFGLNPGVFWFSRMSCDGSEDNVLKCSHSGFNRSRGFETTYEKLCKKRPNDAAARCFSNEIAIKGVRLSTGSHYGRVEILLSGPNEWGTVCDDYWDNRDATVVCRQLGFKSGIAKKSGQFGLGSGPIWLDNVNCKGTEAGIEECTHNGFNIQNCNHMEDAGVICSGNKTKSESFISELTGGQGVVLAATIPIILILMALIVGVGLYFWRQRTASPDKKVLVENDMNDPNPGTVHTEGGVGVTLTKLRAHFSKARTSLQNGNKDTKSPTMSLGNPNYDQMTDSNEVKSESDI